MKKYIKSAFNNNVITTIEELQDELSKVAKSLGAKFEPRTFDEDRYIGYVHGTPTFTLFYSAIEIALDSKDSLRYDFAGIPNKLEIPTHHGFLDISKDNVISPISKTWDLLDAFSDIEFNIK